MTPNSARHLLGLLDVMGGQNNSDTPAAQPPDQRPHVASEIDVDARGRLVEEQHVGLWLSALAIITRRFMPPDSSTIRVSRLSHNERSRSNCSI